MERLYRIYLISARGHGEYVGCTTQTLQARWNCHKQHAKGECSKTTFHEALRVVGCVFFSISLLEEKVCTLAEAHEIEAKYISERKPTYNYSAGGAHDSEAGVYRLREIMDSNPERKEEYLRKLSETKRNNDWSDYPELSVKAEEWRKENPRQAYKNSRRAVRMSPTWKNRKPEKENTLQDRLRLYKKSWKNRRYKDTGYYGVTELSELVGVSPSTIRNWVEKGYVSSYRSGGGHRRFTEEAVGQVKKHAGL